jgi:hypothetical protein
MSMADRMLTMAHAALADALRPVRGVWDEALPLLLCSNPDRPGVSAAEWVRIEHDLARAAGTREPKASHGAAGFFAALREAENLLDGGAVAVGIAAVDSHVGEDALVEHVQNPPSPWATAPAPPAEGAAALVVTSAAEAQRLGLEALGVIHHASTTTGLSNDDNDLPADGEAMASLLRQLPPLRAPAALVFGQSATDQLRQAEWQIAVARNPWRVHPEYEMRSIEAELGMVGAAAGAMNLVYGLAVARHRTTDMPIQDFDPFFAWAISRDGTRGLAAVSVKP